MFRFSSIFAPTMHIWIRVWNLWSDKRFVTVGRIRRRLVLYERLSVSVPDLFTEGKDIRQHLPAG